MNVMSFYFVQVVSVHVIANKRKIQYSYPKHIIYNIDECHVTAEQNGIRTVFYNKARLFSLLVEIASHCIELRLESRV